MIEAGRHHLTLDLILDELNINLRASSGELYDSSYHRIGERVDVRDSLLWGLSLELERSPESALNRRGDLHWVESNERLSITAEDLNVAGGILSDSLLLVTVDNVVTADVEVATLNELYLNKVLDTLYGHTGALAGL